MYEGRKRVGESLEGGELKERFGMGEKKYLSNKRLP